MFTDDFPEGFFFIRCRDTEMTLDVNRGGMVVSSTQLVSPPLGRYLTKLLHIPNSQERCEYHYLATVLDIRGGDIKRDKPIIQYARKPGLAYNQRWMYQDGYICSKSMPNLVVDIRGGEFAEAAQIFLNVKDPASRTQQWLIEPFEDPRSKQDLALLRPPPLQKHLTEFPQPEDLCTYHRLIYHNHKPNPSPKEVAGAAAFEAMRIYIADRKRNNMPYDDPQARAILEGLVGQQMEALKGLAQGNHDEILHTAEQAAYGYFAREYETH
ncbi:hypothetical protein BX666DRAFT_2025281 [Dichotomocladium elegans]|nr:hypothetical protein BX666DRAFT_2025281 [Dichotomocladium elegans]